MIDENNTQQQITPLITFENVVAAIRLGEDMLRKTETVETFNSLMLQGKRNRPQGDDSFLWEKEHYQRAKNAIADDGDGLGKDFIRHFMPPGAVPKSETLQSILDSHYADRRKAAAFRDGESGVTVTVSGRDGIVLP